MEQQLLTPEELQKQEAERLSPQATLSTTQPATHQEGDERLDPVLVEDLMRRLNEAEGTHSNPHWMREDEREALMEQLTRQAHVQQRRRKWSMRIYLVSTALYLGLTTLSLTGRFSGFRDLTYQLPIFYLVAILSVRLAEKRLGRAAKRIAQFDDVRAVGPLMEALDLPDQTVVANAAQALVHLFPRLKAGDSSLITAEQRACLYQRLKRCNVQNSEEFLIVALGALEQIGDAKALPSVEALITRAALMSNPVHQAAIHCLAMLQAQAEQKQASASLLRASSPLDTPSEALLRPALENPSPETDQLLRSSDSER